jgi:hypothetical protein
MAHLRRTNRSSERPNARRWQRGLAVLAVLFSTMSRVGMATASAAPEAAGYGALVRLFDQWRDFQRPVVRGGLPDYTSTAMAAKAAKLPEWRQRLETIDPTTWPIEQQNDYKLVRAEMNGLDFDLRVLQPWARDPAFYVSIWPTLHRWRILYLLHNHAARIAPGNRGRKENVAIRCRIASRLSQHAKAKIVHVGFKIDLLFEHALSRHIAHATCDHSPGLTASM